MKTYGSRAEVMHGNAVQTAGGLKKNDLTYNKHGRIVSKKRQEIGKKLWKNMQKGGYSTKKGQFGIFKDGVNITKK